MPSLQIVRLAASSSCRFFVTVSILINGLLVTPLAARAGTYTVTYSGGTCTTTPGSTSNYGSNGTSYGGGNGSSCYTMYQGYPTSFSVSASGTITATFTWNDGGQCQ